MNAAIIKDGQAGGVARRMASGPVIDLATLPQRHPQTGELILKLCGPAFVHRLSMDPTPLPKGTVTREVTVDRLSPKTGGVRIEEVRELGWGEATGLSAKDCEHLPYAFNEQRITEDAAIAVMALLIHELESVTLEKVVDIGSGADYTLSLKKWGRSAQVEVSGIREDGSGSRSGARLSEKCDQLLRQCPLGFVSVTTFRRLKAGVVHSYLHFVEQDQAPDTGRKRKGRRR